MMRKHMGSNKPLQLEEYLYDIIYHFVDDWQSENENKTLHA